MKVILLFLSSFLALWLLLSSSLSPFLSCIFFFSLSQIVRELICCNLEAYLIPTTPPVRLDSELFGCVQKTIGVFLLRLIVVQTDETTWSERASDLHRCTQLRAHLIQDASHLWVASELD